LQYGCYHVLMKTQLRISVKELMQSKTLNLHRRNLA